MRLLQGKVAVVTGGAQGIGLAIARRFVDEGACVVLGDLSLETAQQAATELGGDEVARAVACDVTSYAQVEALVDTARRAFGAVDVLVDNAGITRDATMKNMTEDMFDQVVAVHLRGAWNGTKVASLVMREQGTGGAVINISSISGKVGNFGQTNYSAAKAGIVGLTKAAAKETARHGIRVNAIQPGLIRSAMTDAMPADVLATKAAEIPLGRVGETDEVAKVALFLASDLSSYVTGTVTEVAGGRGM
jgi:3-oxoacyl-[acyl-carrier protein] reductase